MSALNFHKARAGLYTAQRNDHVYEIEKGDRGWQVRYGDDLTPIGEPTGKLSVATNRALTHLAEVLDD